MEIKADKVDHKQLSDAEGILNNLQSESVHFLQYKYHWQYPEALTIYHDACLLVLDQIQNGKIEKVDKSYFFKVCKNLGANRFRKALTEQQSYLHYWKETRNEYQNTVKNLYGITIFDAPEDDDETKALKALRVFSMLSEKCQEIIKSKYIDGLSHKLIAQRSAHVSSENSAKTVLSRCLKYWKNLNEKTPN